MTTILGLTNGSSDLSCTAESSSIEAVRVSDVSPCLDDETANHPRIMSAATVGFTFTFYHRQIDDRTTGPISRSGTRSADLPPKAPDHPSREQSYWPARDVTQTSYFVSALVSFLGGAFFTYLSIQFTISASVCSTDSRPVYA